MNLQENWNELLRFAQEIHAVEESGEPTGAVNGLDVKASRMAELILERAAVAPANQTVHEAAAAVIHEARNGLQLADRVLDLLAQGESERAGRHVAQASVGVYRVLVAADALAAAMIEEKLK